MRKFLYWSLGIAVFVGILYLQALKEADDRIPKFRVVNGHKYLVNSVRGGEVLTHAGDCPYDKK